MKKWQKHYDREFKEQGDSVVLDHPDLPYNADRQTVRSPMKTIGRMGKKAIKSMTIKSLFEGLATTAAMKPKRSLILKKSSETRRTHSMY
ncbi:hypothetical protein [Dubosiella newyorkensis]|uniref:hypothetical protein n=1 Tax=Dubosiella newyorkensis TaxID=1862672 RepID=UPI003F669E9E